MCPDTVTVGAVVLEVSLSFLLSSDRILYYLLPNLDFKVKINH